MTGEPLRLLLVDDHEMVRAGLRTFLDLQDDMVVAGDASSAEQALALIPTDRPDIVVMYLQLPGNCRSIRTMSGRTDGTSARACSADEASPATTKSSCRSRNERRPARTISWTSTSSSRSGSAV
ncbi:MAG: hypothetical protein QOD41_2403, partial [Cryptosporangiaceae bacterium]|nr:hypothetical protein [Cryptosporangiaceae bacterium]